MESGRLISEARYGNLAQVKYLLGKGIDVDSTDHKGGTALFAASAKGHIEVVLELIRNKADVNIMTEDGSTPLIAATCNGHLGVVKALIKGKADVNKRNPNYATALRYASSYNEDTSIMNELLDAGADFNVQEKIGITPLMISCKKGRLDQVHMLLKKGADVNLKCKKNLKALDYANQQENTDIIEALTNVSNMVVFIFTYLMLFYMSNLFFTSTGYKDGGYSWKC